MTLRACVMSWKLLSECVIGSLGPQDLAVSLMTSKCVFPMKVVTEHTQSLCPDLPWLVVTETGTFAYTPQTERERDRGTTHTQTQRLQRTRRHTRIERNRINHPSALGLQKLIALFHYFTDLVNIGLVEEHCLLHDDLQCLNMLIIRHLCVNP